MKIHIQIEFKPKKASERSAIALRGKVWNVENWSPTNRCLIRSLDGKGFSVDRRESNH